MKKFNQYIALFFFTVLAVSLNAQTVQGTIKASTTDDNCVDIYMMPSADVTANPGNYVFALSIPDQTATGMNPNPEVAYQLPGMVLDAGNPPPYIADGRYFMDFNFTFVSDVDVAWTGGMEYLASTVCFPDGTADVAELIQMNDEADFGANGFTSWYVEFDGLGDITNYGMKFYDDGGTTATAMNGADSQVETIEAVNLPITLQEFTVTKLSGKSKLDWITSSEVNGSHFEIERSEDANTWEQIGTVKAVGESTVEQTYTKLDESLPLNLRSEQPFYYRLKMVDNDGTFEYSDVRRVVFNADGENFIVYPNPSTSEVYVNLSSITTETGAATMHIFNADGQRVKEVALPTSDDVRVDISSISNGIYHFVVRQGDKTFSQRVVKID